VNANLVFLCACYVLQALARVAAVLMPAWDAIVAVREYPMIVCDDGTHLLTQTGRPASNNVYHVHIDFIE